MNGENSGNEWMGKRPQVSQPTISGAHTELVVCCSAGTAERGKHLSSWDRTTVAPELYRPHRSVTFTQPREALLILLHKALSTATNTSTQADGQREVLVWGRGHLGSWGTQGQSWGTRGQQWMNILRTDSFTPQAAIVHERVFHDL